jgi:hypothetical protein
MLNKRIRKENYLKIKHQAETTRKIQGKAQI